jgi:hypothetical protein
MFLLLPDVGTTVIATAEPAAVCLSRGGLIIAPAAAGCKRLLAGRCRRRRRRSRLKPAPTTADREGPRRIQKTKRARNESVPFVVIVVVSGGFVAFVAIRYPPPVRACP